MATIAELKARQQAMKSVYKDAVESKTQGRQKDERFWSPAFDKENGGSATIRFLPAHPDEMQPWVEVIKHAFKGPTGKYYFNNSLRTIGESDPVALLNSALYNSPDPQDKEIQKNQKRKTRYIFNILVIKDPANPSNEGKVFLYETGPQIYGLIKDAMFPEPATIDEDDENTQPFDPFDPFTGANLRIVMVPKALGKDIVPNYDKTTFGKRNDPIKGGDKAIEQIWSQVHRLEPFKARSEFKTYEELCKELLEATGPYIGSGIDVAAVIKYNASSVQRVPVQQKSNVSDSNPVTSHVGNPNISDDDAEFLASLN